MAKLMRCFHLVNISYRGGHKSLMRTVEEKRVKYGDMHRIPYSSQVRFADLESSRKLLQ